ncbi:MAG TPA: hypothetical protein VH765_06390 [Xanthobacteraceae bacterium]|jgi:hypothetical protein
MTARLSAALALVLLLPILASEAQQFPNWRRPGAGAPGAPRVDLPLRRSSPQLPNYYLERGGPVIAPSTPNAPIAPGDVANSLRLRGFNNIGPVQRRGATSITEAVGPGGERVQLVIGPNGEIVGARVINPPR